MSSDLYFAISSVAFCGIVAKSSTYDSMSATVSGTSSSGGASNGGSKSKWITPTLRGLLRIASVPANTAFSPPSGVSAKLAPHASSVCRN